MTATRNTATAGHDLHAPLGALAIGVVLFAGVLLWARFGEAVYIERLFGALANCF